MEKINFIKIAVLAFLITVPTQAEEMDFPSEFVPLSESLDEMFVELDNESVDSTTEGDRTPANAFNYRITSGPGKRRAPKRGASTYHKGTDYGAPCGTSVPARQGGVVTKAGRARGYGNTVAISNGSCRQIYAHLSSISVSVGQTVSAGKQVGRVGSTGISTGCHLHYESCSGLYGSGGGGGSRKKSSGQKTSKKNSGKSKKSGDESGVPQPFGSSN